MVGKKLILFCSLLLASSVWATDIINGIDLDQLGQELVAHGLHGWIHGAANDLSEYVFTYRDSNDFFKAVQLSMVAANPQVSAKLTSLGRNDEVTVYGQFIADNPSRQKHILLSDLTVVKKFDPGISSTPFVRQTQLPRDLMGMTELVGRVHAVAADGEILVMEYRDAVVPVFVTKPALTQNLFRGDKVKLAFQIMKFPKHPTHLMLDAGAPQPVQVLESIASRNGEAITQEGYLVLFPQSPEILFSVFAMRQDDAEGTRLNFTLVNFDDPSVFQAIRAKLQAAWDTHPEAVVNDRNQYLNRRVRVKVSGTLNEVSASQANPQILLKSPDDITVID